MKNSKATRGFSFVEVMIVVSILVVILGVIFRTTKMSTDASDYAKKQGELTILGQTRLLMIREDVSASIRLYTRDMEGWTYWSTMDHGTLTPIANAVPITIDSNGSFKQEAPFGIYTGNLLMFAKTVRPFPTTEEKAIWDDRCDTLGVPGNKAALDNLRIDVYRIVAYFISPVGGTVNVGSARDLDLVRWVSEPFADWDRVLDIDGAIQPTVIQALSLDSLRGINYVWRPGTDAYTAFAEIQGDYSLDSINTQTTHLGWEIPFDRRWTEDSIFIRKDISIASMWAPSNYGLGKFNAGYTSSWGYPHGFETQVIGPTSARQVLIHMVLISQRVKGQNAWIDLQEIVTCRDL